MTDKQLNDYIEILLNVSHENRIASNGRWAQDLDCAVAMWTDKHPGSRPPAYAKIGQSLPACFSGTLPPIYDGELE